MRKINWKRYVTEAAILIVIFLLAVKVFGYFTNKGNDNMTADMGAATYPQVSFEYGGYTINALPGYSKEMDVSAMRDTITPVSGGKLDINIKRHDQTIVSAVCSVWSLDGKENILEQTVNEPGKTITFQVNDTSVLEQEKVLGIALNLEGNKTVYYYTRIVDADGKDAGDCLDYVKNFHENALGKVENVGVGAALEPDETGGTSFSHVTIHSDYDHVTWGELEPTVEGNETWQIKELNDTSCSIQLLYQVRTKGEENDEDISKVKEFFRVRYDSAGNKGVLLDYDRTMDQIFDPTKTILSEKGLLLGITDSDVSYLVNKDGTKVAFVQADELWHYNRDTDEISKVFSFASTENADERNNVAQHKIELLEMDKSGNISFAVYGYMNRGEHEGEVGIAVYSYHVEQNSVEEMAFISTDKSYGHTVHELGEMVYYSANRNMLYAISDGTLYEIDVEKSRVKELVSGLSDGQYVVSENRKMAAYQTGESREESSEVKVLNLSSGNERTVTCEEGESILPLGFMGTDFVYGLAKDSDIGKSVSGETVIPMYKIEIESSKGKVIKTYEEEDIYTLGAVFEENMITLERVKKSGDTYRSIVEDHITNNEEKAESNISVETYATSLKQTQVRLTYSDGIGDKEPKLLKPKQILHEQAKVFSFDDQSADGDTKESEEGSAVRTQYLVYGIGELQGIYENAGEAVRQADAYSGVVVTSTQEYVWERGNRYLQYTITERDDDLKTLENLLKSGTSPVAALEQINGRNSRDLTGCTVEELMYIINTDRPVVAMRNEKKAIILVGYTETKVTYIDAETGNRKTVDVDEIEKMTEESGNTYIA